MNWTAVTETLLGQLGALTAFLAFPALQYFLLRRMAHRDGKPELWYLPKYGFRLVIRNLPRRRTLSSIHYRTLLRTVVPSGDGASVATFQDENLLDREDFFLFPGTDQVLIAFKLERGPTGTLAFVHTDKLGNQLRRFEITEGMRIVADFTANLENWFNFDIAIARRVEINDKRLSEIAESIRESNIEQEFEVSRIREVG